MGKQPEWMVLAGLWGDRRSVVRRSSIAVPLSRRLLFALCQTWLTGRSARRWRRRGRSFHGGPRLVRTGLRRAAYIGAIVPMHARRVAICSRKRLDRTVGR